MKVMSGWGTMVPLTVIVCLGASFLVMAMLGFSTDDLWMGMLAAGVVAGAIIWVLARKADALPGGAGSFFFMPTRHWAFLTPFMMTLMALGARAPGGLAG